MSLYEASIIGRNALHLPSSALQICDAQVWCGSKQGDLEVNSMQLMDQYCPWAVIMLTFLVPCTDLVGWDSHKADTLLGYEYTIYNVALIALSGILGALTQGQK